jgi:hypothetical protein
MQANTFDAVPKRKHVTMFKFGKLWVFKYFFEDKTLFLALLGSYNKDQYRFEYDLLEDLKGYVVQLPKSAKYAQVLT